MAEATLREATCGVPLDEGDGENHDGEKDRDERFSVA
jgi:hypothetical protein